MNKKIFSLLILFILIFSSNLVFADIIMPGFKSISHEIEIKNISEYLNDYVFFVIGEPSFCEPQLIGSDSPRSLGYKFCKPILIAIDKKCPDSENLLRGGGDPSKFDFCTNNGYISYFDININRVSKVTGANPIKKIVEIIEIENISSNQVTTKSTVKYEYNDGGTELIPYKTNTRPQPSRFLIYKNWWFILLLSLIITIFVEYFLIRKKFTSKNTFKNIAIINIITLPFATLTYEILVMGGFLSYILTPFILFLLIELIIIFVESFLIKQFFDLNYLKSLLLSFKINLVTMMLGIIICVIALFVMSF